MWWPRPRWKNNLFTRFTLLLIVTITLTSNTVMADEEGQNCATINISAVVWTTALCTMLLVMVVIAIYFVYCKRREHDWSSLWWKNNSDKNLVLQTSGPTKDHQLLKKGGTDNPAFLADCTNIDDRAAVGKAGFTRIIRVPSSAIDSGSLGIELSSKEDGGRSIYMCKHSDGSKDRLASLRLVFDHGQKQLCSSSSDLGRALVELSREYGLIVELETCANGESVAPTSGKAENGADEATLQKCSKSNILSNFRGKAQSFWNHRQFAFKAGEKDNDRVNANKQIVGVDVENGPAKESAVSTVRNSPCSAVTMVDETAPVGQSARTGNESVRYRTLEYGASGVDPSTDSSVQCCTINSSAPPPAVVQHTAMAEHIDAGELDAIDGDGAKSNKPINDRQKPAASNPAPPPPPPRKYSTPAVIPSVPALTCTRVSNATPETETAVVSSAVSAAVVSEATAVTASIIAQVAANVTASPLPTAEQVAPITADVTASLLPTASPVTPIAADVTASPLPTADQVAPIAARFSGYSAPVKRSAASTENEIRMSDDYFWCTTTAMASPMSTFGKQLVFVGDSDVTTRAAEVNDATGGSVETARKTEITVPSSDANCTAGGVVLADDGRGVGQDIAIGDTNCSIEDASLPSFSSDDDDDDDDRNGVFTEKIKPSLFVVTAADAPNPSTGECRSTPRVSTLVSENGDDRDKNASDRVVANADCNGHLENNANVAPVNSAVRSAPEPKPATKLPSLRPLLSSPLQSSAATTTSSCSTSSSSSSPTNNGSINHSPIVSKIPVRRQSAGSGGGTPASVVSTHITSNGTAKKAIPLPLSRSGSRLAMWTSAN